MQILGSPQYQHSPSVCLVPLPGSQAPSPALRVSCSLAGPAWCSLANTQNTHTHPTGIPCSQVPSNILHRLDTPAWTQDLSLLPSLAWGLLAKDTCTPLPSTPQFGEDTDTHPCSSLHQVHGLWSGVPLQPPALCPSLRSCQSLLVAVF